MSKHLSRLLLLFSVCTSVACVTGVDPVLRQKSANISIHYDNDVPWPYSRLGQVEGLSCGQQLTNPHPDVEDAETRLRIAAYKVGAESVIDVKCVQGDTDWKNNCDNTVRCKGEGIRWLKKSPVVRTSKPPPLKDAQSLEEDRDDDDKGQDDKVESKLSPDRASQ